MNFIIDKEDASKIGGVFFESHLNPPKGDFDYVLLGNHEFTNEFHAKLAMEQSREGVFIFPFGGLRGLRMGLPRRLEGTKFHE